MRYLKYFLLLTAVMMLAAGGIASVIVAVMLLRAGKLWAIPVLLGFPAALALALLLSDVEWLFTPLGRK